MQGYYWLDPVSPFWEITFDRPYILFLSLVCGNLQNQRNLLADVADLANKCVSFTQCFAPSLPSWHK